ncbi:helix-turn-helix domain-containing protein [Iningainema tapete]|uniref:DNA-binding protein n=1 Tax=Iningainema tapete BLCC-T55 TaxID=2748662 RepID=A0A8J6XLY2_9CYAN|nr:helix-turn-helix transcriptional regulator [Iningainema tapete]MBD2775286.1 DNA-binding protein [Iningainema tapete BLCC-T55]
MIKDEKQYEYSQECVRGFEKSLAALEQEENYKKSDPEGWTLHARTIQYHLDALNAEIAEYEMLTSHDRQTPIVLKLDDIDYLPRILIKARMAAKLSQKELANLAGLTEEQIQRYEDKDYEDASYLDVRAVIHALDIKLQSSEFLVPLDTLRRTPITKEELLSSRRNKSNQNQQQVEEFQQRAS